jgi:hypothetical protein
MLHGLYALLQSTLAKRTEMRSNEPFDVLHHDGKDRVAKLLHRDVPLLDDSSDECLLDDERVATREFPCASSSNEEGK